MTKYQKVELVAASHHSFFFGYHLNSFLLFQLSSNIAKTVFIPPHEVFAILICFLKNSLSWSKPLVVVHAAPTISLHLALDSHISSNLNILFFGEISKLVGLTSRGRWSKELHDRWVTLPGNFKNQLFVTKSLSNISHIELPSSKCLLV